jgi:hypothetical protein
MAEGHQEEGQKDDDEGNWDLVVTNVRTHPHP